LERRCYRLFTGPEEALKDILKTLKNTFFLASPLQAFLPEKIRRREFNSHPIVFFPSRFVGKNLVSLQDLSKAELCSFVPRVGGELISAGQLLVRPLDLLFGSASRDSQDVVIIFS
jgi:hypothetical protein